MVTPVSYPGIYTIEFAPGAPIQGVGTSTAAFIGTSASGPVNEATLIESWDEFVATFGTFITEPPTSYLPPAVYGFFLNGGTACYIVRAATGTNAEIGLSSRQGGNNPDPILIARARQEGPMGNTLSAEVLEASRLATMLRAALTPRTITAVSGDRLTLTLNSNQGYAVGLPISISLDPNEEQATIAEVQGQDQLVLASAIPGNEDFTSGTVSPAGILLPRYIETNITNVHPSRLRINVDSIAGFAPGDRLRFNENNEDASGRIASIEQPNTLVLDAPIAGAHDFTGGTVRIGDLQPGQRTIRVANPSSPPLNQAMPRGTMVSISDGNNGEVRIVESAGGDSITLSNGLTNSFSLDDPANLPTISSLEFDLRIIDAATGSSETFERVAMHPDHPTHWTTIESGFITLSEPDSFQNPIPPDSRPAEDTYELANGTPDDRDAARADIIGDPNRFLELLRPADEISIVAIPGETDPFVQQAIITHCESTHDRFGILDSIPGSDTTAIRNQYADVRSERGFAALYYPWIVARNPATRADEQWPPSGHMAGVYARIDTQRGVHKAPANTVIRGALGLERRLTDTQQGPLNLLGINVLRVFPGQGQPLVWGARTNATDRNWQYINVRRLFLFLEESIEEGIRWAVFEPNNRQLWQKLRRTISEFLARVWRGGALFGATADEAFYVRIDDALNPESEQRLGRLNIEIGIRPTYPAEFIIMRIGIWQGGSEVTEG